MSTDLEYLINHVFLPPKRPQKDDSRFEADVHLIEELLAALKEFQAHLLKQQRAEWGPCIKMLSNMLELRDHFGGLVPQKLERKLRGVIDGDILALHINAQNAGIIVRKFQDQYSFESFELAPTNAAVFETRGRLIRCFPGPAIAIGQERISDDSFAGPIVELLAKLDAETPEEALPLIRKAGSEVSEIRDTVHPMFVTEMLTGILRGIGQPLEVSRIHKHTREDVLWKNEYKPWHRSPFWLCLRVALQTTLMSKNDVEPHLRYKSFMIFFMACILKNAVEASLPSDLLFIMKAKISGRALKLGAIGAPDWLLFVEIAMKGAQQEMDRRWESKQKHQDLFETQQDWRLSQLSFFRDTKLRLATLQPYLAKVQARLVAPLIVHHSIPHCIQRISQCSSSLPDLSLLQGVESSSDRLNLADLEQWVQGSLNDWLQANIEREDTCITVSNVINAYMLRASSTYWGVPEDNSVMILTVMELWIALDKCAINHCPLLKDYDPGLPPALFEPLLLPWKSQMQRLLTIEQYLAARVAAAMPRRPSIFRSVKTEESFAVRYFQQSAHHQDLKARIEAQARDERSQKKLEFVKKRQQFEDLKKASDEMSCEYVTQWKKRKYVSVHSNSCKKCQLKATAESLSIEVHEWPLPNSKEDLEAKAVVFELDVPMIVSKWRDSTYCILIDIFSAETPSQRGSNKKKAYTLHKYTGLKRFAKSQPTRLQLASVAKPFVESHYQHLALSRACESMICVNNGLNYSSYDSETERWTENVQDRYDVRGKCTPKLPAGPYLGLQYAIDNTGHSSNELIASQASCHKALTMHEFYAFGTLRAGHRLQWRNIARELNACTLQFNCDEVHALIIQAAWQVGQCSCGEFRRESHVDLDEEEFGKSLLSALDEAIKTIEGNWQKGTAAHTFVNLAARLLSLSSSDTIREGCFRFLRKARAIALAWTRELGQKLQQEQQEETLRNLNLRALEIALTCHGTLDVESEHLHRLLESDEDIADVTECSIIVHDRCPAVINKLPASIKSLLRRYWRLSHHLEPLLRTRILNACRGLNKTIGRLWAGYVPGSQWTSLNSPSERWLVTETSSGDGQSSMLVHYNLLDGNLLVNGSPLARLPRSYESHPTFVRLFGDKILDVVPSTMPGMVFGARTELFGYELYFGMYDSELIVRAKKQGQTYELLPVHALDGDLPQAFVQDYAHWLDVDTRSVEWRPLDNAWTSTSQSWKMQLGHWREYSLTRGSSKLVDMHTHTAKSVSAVLSPLENATNLHIIFNCETELLEVHLPRLKLDFCLRKGSMQLESKQFRGMMVDTNQSFGTMTGLVNKLVLCGSTGSLRSVIIPYGEVNFERVGSHVRVGIDTGSSQHRSYHHYQIDRQLGRLVDSGSLKSTLFRCYIHAVTAHCLPDELTGRTGTEEALATLASASVRSFLSLDHIEIYLLALLARLTPRRQYYPEHLRVMQKVTWQKLSPLLQHDSFDRSVQSIFERAKMLSLFHENPLEISDSDMCGNSDLLERAAIRNSKNRVHGFGAENQTTEHDIFYIARDRVSDNTRESQVCHTAKLVDDWSTNLKVYSHLLEEIESWRTSLDGDKQEDVLALGYDRKWLKSPTHFLPEDWCTVQAVLSGSVMESDKYKIMVFLSTLAYSQYAKQELVQTLLAFATVPKLRAIRPPDYPVFALSHGYAPDTENLMGIAGSNARAFSSCPESELSPLFGETSAEADDRRRDEHHVALDECRGLFADDLISQWPTAAPHDPIRANLDVYIWVNQATAVAKKKFQQWYCNARFKEYIEQTQEPLNSLGAGDQKPRGYSFPQPSYQYCPKQSYVGLEDIMARPAPDLPTTTIETFQSWLSWQYEGDFDRSKLKSVLNRLYGEFSGQYEERYAIDLLKSLHSLHEKVDGRLVGSLQALKPLLETHLQICKKHVEDIYQAICNCLRTETSTRQLACDSKMWPRLSTISLLQNLAGCRVALLREDWKRYLIEYGKAISNLQRAERLLPSIENELELLSELSNPGHQGWDPVQYPDWLLLEIENNILVRGMQAEIAHEMISPSSGGNSIMQLNMGEGKSSVIVPIVSAALADRKKLVRVIVLKSLAAEMCKVLVRKLGGMLGRQIFHLPFSRSIQLDRYKAQQIQNMCEECMQTGGILLVQPEHVLSFELMGLERYLSGEPQLGRLLTNTQHWLDSNTRDILDESDEILSVRFELIYTMGLQRAIEFSPDRWTIIEHVLMLMSRFAEHVLEDFPQGLELLGPADLGSFPRIRLLQSTAADALLKVVAEEICEAGVPGVPLWKFPQDVRNVLLKYITALDTSEAEIERLRQHIDDVDSMKRGLLLLRGLIAGGVLAFAFEQKRWRVNYELDLSRTMLAVPYRAKDSPAARAEFSHSDATIVLTCLSYYYGGLSDEQLYTAFEKLSLCDQAQEEYEGWVQNAPRLPSKFRQLTGVNLSDQGPCSEVVFNSLRFAKRAIDFYLSKIVFPKEMKEFPHKLSCSGWDIARKKPHPTTDFSGTNDSRYILPLSMKQCELPAQLHTNAAVLDCLLRPENTFYHATRGPTRGSLDAESLLDIVTTSEPSVRVILDVGAQVLEWKNKEVAGNWLSRAPGSDVQAAIYFNDDNDLSVLTRDGISEALMISPFAKQMDQCLVYLDEAHTRGTDLKLPTNYRAAVPLGPGLTKDRLVQACMRMRKLGKGQSVMFCASTEVERKIIDRSGKKWGDTIEVTDVLRWAISETFIDTKRCIPLWATQGMRYQHRHAAWSDSLVNGSEAAALSVANSLLEPEARSLEDRYEIGRRRSEEDVLLHNVKEKSLSSRGEQVEAIRKKCQEFKQASLSNATLREEQERELSPESEQERQVERPPALTPFVPTIHDDVRRFIQLGTLDRRSSAFHPAFAILGRTAAVQHLEWDAWPSNLLITRDFAWTVNAPANQQLDSYLRPVHWLATSRNSNTFTCVILSPYETHELLPLIRQYKAVTLHIYSPRVSMSTRTLEDLSFCSIPPTTQYCGKPTAPPFIRHLNLFAGQLYFRDYDEYLAVCRFLGLSFRPLSKEEQDIRVGCDGFVGVEGREVFDEVMGRECRFTRSPMAVLNALVGMRRKGQGVQRSDLGRVLMGDLLKGEEF